MSRAQTYLLPLLAFSLLLLTGALGRKALPSAGSPALEDADGPGDAAGAAALLDKTIDALAPARVRWLEMTLWQKVSLDDENYEVQGRYLSAPDNRMRLELKVQVGRTRGEVCVVCDGNALCTMQRLGSEAPLLVPNEIPAAEPGKGRAEVAEKRARFLQDAGYGGVMPLLRLLRQRLQDLDHRIAVWQERDIHLVTGRWPEDAALLASIPEFLRPRCPPRKCRIFLDAHTLWPCRIEWWGSEKPGGRLEPLLQLEFRDPILNQPLSPERCRREFTLPSVSSEK